jgi:Ca-activated chloride channel family protein
MLVDDVGMRRLEKARALVDALVPKLANDRVGAVVFAGTAAHFPLTDDKQVAAQFLHDLGPADLPGGSSLEEAIRVGACMLKPDSSDPWGGRCQGTSGPGHGGDPVPGEADDTPHNERVEEITERSKVLMLITDGADGLGGGHARSAVIDQVESAKRLGITLVVVGIGTESGGDVPELNVETGEIDGFKIGPDGRRIRSELDGDSLRKLAELGGGADRYFEIGQAEIDVAPLVAELNALTRGSLEKKSGRAMDEWYAAFLFPGFMLLVIEACLGTRKRVRYPEGNP